MVERLFAFGSSHDPGVVGSSPLIMLPAAPSAPPPPCARARGLAKGNLKKIKHYIFLTAMFCWENFWRDLQVLSRCALEKKNLTSVMTCIRLKF